MTGFQNPGAVGNGPGERALAVPEQRAFQQGGGQRGQMHRLMALPEVHGKLARTFLKRDVLRHSNGLCHQLLAGAGGSQHQRRKLLHACVQALVIAAQVMGEDGVPDVGPQVGGKARGAGNGAIRQVKRPPDLEVQGEEMFRRVLPLRGQRRPPDQRLPVLQEARVERHAGCAQFRLDQNRIKMTFDPVIEHIHRQIGVMTPPGLIQRATRLQVGQRGADAVFPPLAERGEMRAGALLPRLHDPDVMRGCLLAQHLALQTDTLLGKGIGEAQLPQGMGDGLHAGGNNPSIAISHDWRGRHPLSVTAANYVYHGLLPPAITAEVNLHVPVNQHENQVAMFGTGFANPGCHLTRRPLENTMKPGFRMAVLACVIMTGSVGQAAGLLQTVGSAAQSLRMVDHDVNVLINNGFARVEVTQRFSNSGEQKLEAVYRFPLPRGASLSEMRILSGENAISGEVLAKEQAQAAYASEKQQGRDAGLASEESGRELEFRVAQIEPRRDVTVSFVYYQPVVVDTGIGRFVYPLQEGGTDDGTPGFWNFNDRVENSFSVNLKLKSAWPVESMRAPGLESLARVEHADPYHWTLKSEQKGGSLNRDFVVYYRLADNLPGRVEVIPYRAAASGDGTFMMVVTPGVDLQPLQSGSDFVFVLDVSGSMQAKLPILLKGVSQALGRMSGQDRFRVVVFNDRSREVVPWTAATPDNVQQALSTLGGLTASGGTNLYAGLETALHELDISRTTSLILVTDGVANTGIVDPKSFAELVKKVDLRLFGFVMGNNANWPLVSLIAEASGGFYAGVSNDDDIVGQILLARSKLTSQAMHNVQLDLSGGGVHDVTGGTPKIYRGQQVVLFGLYNQPGKTKNDAEGQSGGAGQDLHHGVRLAGE